MMSIRLQRVPGLEDLATGTWISCSAYVREWSHCLSFRRRERRRYRCRESKNACAVWLAAKDLQVRVHCRLTFLGDLIRATEVQAETDP